MVDVAETRHHGSRVGVVKVGADTDVVNARDIADVVDVIAATSEIGGNWIWMLFLPFFYLLCRSPGRYLNQV